MPVKPIDWTQLNHINILGETFQVLHRDLRRHKVWGDTDVPRRVIRIERSLTGTAFRDVLGHEMCHAILGLSGLNLAMSHEQEEKFCDAFGRALMILWEENIDARD